MTTKPPLRRYELADVGSPYQPWREMREADDGEWVRAEDALSRIAELEADRDALKTEFADRRRRVDNDHEQIAINGSLRVETIDDEIQFWSELDGWVATVGNIVKGDGLTLAEALRMAELWNRAAESDA